MKKIIIITAVLCLSSLVAVVWVNDPTLTPEQRAKAEELNATIRKKNEEREALRNKEIAAATEMFIGQINAINAKYPPIVG